MVPNGSAYANFPSFANNGTKTPPGGSTESAKYALGMVPADTFPAEWANYLFHGATAGITRLNADTGSIKKEINTVLDNFNISPDATLNNQLLAALNKLKADAALAAHPVGSLYWTSVNENPAVTFGGGTWEQIKDKFILAAGDTYSQGSTGGSATVTLTTNQIPSHTHTFTGSAVTSETNNRGHVHSVGAHSHTINLGNTSSSGTVTTAGIRHSGTTGGMSGNSTGTFNVVQSSQVVSPTGNFSVTWSAGDLQGLGGGNNKAKISLDVAHTHSLPASYIYGKTDNSTAFNSETESQNHTHRVTASGTNSDTGGGQSHDNMPPYIVQYCWKRTA